MSEFPQPDYLPRRGLTSIEAAAFLKQEFPQVAQWTCWMGHGHPRSPLRCIVGKDSPSSGTIGSWSWKRVPMAYPVPAYWVGDELPDTDDGGERWVHPAGIKGSAPQDDPLLCKGDQWVGMIEVTGAKGERFLLFSYLSSKGCVGSRYFASTQDIRLLSRFARDARLHFMPQEPDKIMIDVTGGADITLEAAEEEIVVLPDEMKIDIEEQAFSFFESREDYKRMRLRHRRGFLFVGEPGTGKTMMLRHLIRECHQRFRPRFFMLTIRRDTDEDDVSGLFARAARSAPAMVILEDMDSLTTQSRITRSAFLSQLDGVSCREGLLIIGTTNHPDDIDPALVHRPSRFDRVWHFPLPDHELRRRYLDLFFKNVDEDALRVLAEHTRNWSFAYLKELYTTASIMAIARAEASVSTELLLDAFDLLDQQFRAGKRNHVVQRPENPVGFAAIRSNQLTEMNPSGCSACIPRADATRKAVLAATGSNAVGKIE